MIMRIGGADGDLTGRIVGNKVHGLGISNMKGGLAAFMIAGKALKQSGIKLKGDVILAAVVGEISRSPIGPWQSQEYRGEGVGTRHLLTHGMHTDYAVCCDETATSTSYGRSSVSCRPRSRPTARPRALWAPKRSGSPDGRSSTLSSR